MRGTSVDVTYLHAHPSSQKEELVVSLRTRFGILYFLLGGCWLVLLVLVDKPKNGMRGCLKKKR